MCKQFGMIFLTILIGLVTGCKSTEYAIPGPSVPPTANNPHGVGYPPEYYLNLATQAMPPQTQAYQLQAVARLIQQNRLHEAWQLLSNLPDQELPSNLRDEKRLLAAQVTLIQHRNDYAVQELQQIPAPNQLPLAQKMAYYQILAQAQSNLGNPLLSAEARITLSPMLTDPIAQQKNNQAIWADLNQLSSQDLATRAQNTPPSLLQGWLEITYITKQFSNEPQLLQTERSKWQQRYPQHPANSMLNKTPATSSSMGVGIGGWFSGKDTESSPKAPHIALLVPLSGPLANSGQAIKSGFTAAIYDARSNSGNLSNSLQTYDTHNADITALYSQAVKAGATVVIGPLQKDQVAALEKMGTLPVPTLALNYTSTGAVSSQRLYQFALSPQDEARQAAEKAWQDGHHRALIIASSESWSAPIVKSFKQTWHALGGQVIDTVSYNNGGRLDQTIKQALRSNDPDKKKANKTSSTTANRRQDVDMIFLVATPKMGRQINPLLKFYYAGDLPVYATAQIFGGNNNPMQNKDLDGIRFCDIPWVFDESTTIRHAKQQMGSILPNASAQQSKLFAFGYDAYSLSKHLNPPSLSSYTGIPGMTGTLYLDNHQIFRQLEWAQFQSGSPRLITGLKR
jgi:outer membrane PBP1 activator LpoA protein